MIEMRKKNEIYMHEGTNDLKSEQKNPKIGNKVK